MQSRDEVMGRLARGEGDGRVLIIGGGINGIGVFRDLAAQGIPAVLVERGDFASGTSSAPSRLIHGGLRYLETGEFALVRESVEERNRLLLNAPHLVRPIPVWVPALSWTGGLIDAGLRFLKLKRTPGPKGALAVRAGLVIFDHFGKLKRTMPRHRPVPIATARKQIPFAADVRAVLEYWDARIHSPERLSLELVADAEAACPDAFAAPYTEVTSMIDGAVELLDRQTGRSTTIRPSLVVNCAGAWADRVDKRIGVPDRLIGGTRGSHLVLERPDLAAELGDVMLYFETRDHRACLIFRLDERMVLLGTTDLRVTNPDESVCTDAEIDYLFDVLTDLLPEAAPARDQIRFVYSGVRPLPLSGDGATGAISRDHTFRVFEPAPGRPFRVVTLIGGKWTTYRACAEQLTDKILPMIDASRSASTEALAIGGGHGFPRTPEGRAAAIGDIAGKGRITPEDAQRLLDRYGSLGAEVAASFDAEGRRPLAGAPAYHAGEIAWITTRERVTRLEDIVLRRTLMAFEGHTSAATICDCAEIAATLLGWSPERKEAEIAATLDLLASRHRVPAQPQTEIRHVASAQA
ncbi:glycerol-3-phosphate dehydrogenase/oxidase [Rhodobacteraceae bacterium DSL-40]|uniref:glycerol-3-phosphate dehydrogenase/oxidase n=1 Tax=Amaricoccus sp. B4 TaxID=3368557 RepID=UPI000DAC38AA